LIVDASPFGQALTRDTCKAIGFCETLTADEPLEAAKYLTARKVDIVITEWSFTPVSGEKLVFGIRNGKGSVDPYVPIVVLTGFADWAMVAGARDAGATDVLARPIILENFLARLTFTLASPRPFVRSPRFFGPDRRRQVRKYNGPDRRGIEVKSSAPPRTNADLANRVKQPGGLSIDEMTSAGKQVLADRKGQYRELCDADMAELFDLIRELKDDPISGFPLIQPIYRKARQIESLSLTFGYPILAEASSLLCRLLWTLPESRVSSPIIIQGIETHATVMSLIVKQDIGEDDEELREELIGGLAALVEKAAKLD